MTTCARTLILSLFASAALTAHGASLPENFVVEGRLFDTAGAPIAAAVDIQLEVYAEGAPTCVLYREVHSNVNVDSTVNNNNDGVFAVKLGAGTSKPGVFSSSSLASVFANAAPVQGDSNGDNAYDCSRSAVQLTSAARLVRVSVRLTSLGGAYDALSPDTTITSVPSAMVAETLQGRDASGFVQTRDDASYDLNQANVESIFSSANFAKLTQLLTGNQGGGTVTNVGTPSAGTDAVNKNYADGSIGGRIADVSTVGPAAGNGHTLIWDQGANRWVTGTPVATDNTKLPLIGGTLTGPLGMSAQNITNIGHMTLAAQRTLNLGTYTNAQEAALVAGLGAVDKGKIWFNSDLNVNRVWNGSNAVSEAYLNATGKLDATWIPDTAVTAGSYGSATQVPVFSVGADGRITGVTNTAINAAPTGAAGGDLTGSYPNPTLANDSVETAAIQDGAVSTAKIPDNAIFTAKLRNTGIAVNRLLITNASDGTTVTFATCNIGEAMSWTASGWACTTPAALIGNTGVTAATYGSANQIAQFQVDAQGRLTSASNVAISYPVISVAGKTGAVTLNVADVSGLGTAAAKNFGTAAGDLIEVQSSGRLPALDGSLLTNVNATALQTRSVSATAPTANQVLTWNASNSAWEPQTLPAASTGDVTAVTAGYGLTGGSASGDATLAVDVGTTANKIVALDSSARLPAVDGGLLTNLNATRLNNFSVNATAPTNAQVLTWNASASTWEPANLPAAASAPVVSVAGKTGAVTLDVTDIANAGDITTVHSGTGLTGGFASGGGTLSVDVGTTANKIVQLDSSAYLPAIDGRNLTSINAVRLQNYSVNSTAPANAQVLTWNGSASTWEPANLPAAPAAPVVSVAGKTGAVTLDVTDISGAGDITTVQTGVGLTGGFASGGGTLSVDVGTTANKIVQLDSSAQLPAINGSQLTNVSAARLQTRTVSATAPTAGQYLAWNAATSSWEPKTMAASGDFLRNGTASMTGNIRLSGNYLSNDGDNEGVYVDTAGRVGIGTNTPANNLDIVTSDQNAGLHVVNANSTASRYPHVSVSNFIGGAGGGHPGFFMNSANGNASAPTALNGGDTLGALVVRGHNGSGGYNDGAAIRFTASNTFASGFAGTDITFETASNLGGVPAERIRIQNDGGIGINGTASPGFEKLFVGGAIKIGNFLGACGPGQVGMIRYDAGTFYVCSTGAGWSPLGSGSVSEITAGDGLTGGSITSAGTIAIDSSTVFRVDGNTTGAAMTLGTNDAFNLNFETNNTTAMTVSSSGRVGVGTTSPISRFQIVDNTIANSGTYASLNSYLTINPASNSSAAYSNYIAAGVQAGNSSNFTGTINGLVTDAWHDGNGSVTQANGQSVVFTKNGTGPISTVRGLAIDINNSNASGTISNAYGLYIHPYDRTGGMTNSYGVYVADSVATNYFAGNVGIGTAAPASALDVVGNVRAQNFIATGGASGACAQAGQFGYSAGTLAVCNGTTFVPMSTSSGTVTSVVAGTGLSGGNIVSAGTISVNVGTAANQIVQLDTSARLPAINGSQLTQVNAIQLQTRNVASTAPTQSQLLGWNASSSNWEPQTPSIASLGGYVQNGNSFGATAILGTNDNYSLVLETNGTPTMSLLPSGQVGIGTGAPRGMLDVGGVILSQPGVTHTAGPMDMSLGNIHRLTGNCGGYALHNMKDGGHYTFIVDGLARAQCNFVMYSDAGTTGLTEYWPPGHDGWTEQGIRRVYQFYVSGSSVFISWNKDEYTRDNPTNGIEYIALQRSRSDAVQPGAGFGTGVLFNFETSTNGTMTNAGELRVLWEANQTVAADADSSMTFSTALDGSLAERMRITSNGNVGIGTTNPTARLEVTGGTSSIPAIRMTASTPTTTPLGGSIEYDGTAYYATTAPNARGVIPTAQFISLISNYAASTAVGAQRIFNTSTSGALSVTGGTIYEVEGVISIARAGGTAGNLQLGFGGTATYTSLGYSAACTNGAATAAASNNLFVTTAALTTVTPTAATGITNNCVIKGLIRVSGAGTVIPQFSVTVAPTSVTVNANSYMKFTPLGASGTAFVGPWN